MALLVWYGVSKINKIRKKKAIEAMYENDNGNRERTLNLVSRMIHIAYVRNQTKAEEKDAKYPNRVLTTFTMFIDDKKKFGGSVERAIQFNSDIEKNNVSEEERLKIVDALRKEFYTWNPDHVEPPHSCTNPIKP